MVRVVLSNIALREFNMVALSHIAKALNKDHATLYHYIENHNNFFGRDKAYTKLYLSTLSQIKRNIPNKIEKSILINRFINDSTAMNLMLYCVDNIQKAKDMLKNILFDTHLVFEGSKKDFIRTNYEVLLDYDRKKYIENSLKNTSSSEKMYRNYISGLYNIKNNHLASVHSILSQFPVDRNGVIVFMMKEQKEPITKTEEDQEPSPLEMSA
jgi:hypothetical protein